MKWLRRIAKATAITGLVLFLALFVYANWNPPRLADSAQPAYYAAFDLAGNCSPQQQQAIEQSLSGKEGVTAVTVNPSSKMAVIAYNPHKISNPNSLSTDINAAANVLASPKKWEIDPNKPQCPAHGFLAWLDNARAALCIRTR